MSREENLLLQYESHMCRVLADQCIYDDAAYGAVDFGIYARLMDYVECGGCPLIGTCIYQKDEPDHLEQMANLYSSCADEL